MNTADTPTPRTDAHLLQRMQWASRTPVDETTEQKLDRLLADPQPDSWVQFARTLERELSAANAELAMEILSVENLKRQAEAVDARDRAVIEHLTKERDTLAARVSELERDRERLDFHIEYMKRFGVDITREGIDEAMSRFDAAADAVKDNTEENK